MLKLMVVLSECVLGRYTKNDVTDEDAGVIVDIT